MKSFLSLLPLSFLFLLSSCSSEPKKDEQDTQPDTLRIITRNKVDSVFKFRQHIQNTNIDTDVVFNVHITAEKETDTFRFLPAFPAGYNNGKRNYLRDTLHLSKYYTGNVVLKFNPGDSAHIAVLKCDTFISWNNNYLDMAFPQYFFSGNSELICAAGNIRTQHFYMDTFNPILKTSDTVLIETPKQMIRGKELYIDNLYLSEFKLYDIITVFALSPEKP